LMTKGEKLEQRYDYERSWTTKDEKLVGTWTWIKREQH